MRQSLADATARLERFNHALNVYSEAAHRRQLAEAAAQQAHGALATEGCELRSAIGELYARIQETEAELVELAHQQTTAEAELKSTRARANWANMSLGWIGLGPIGKAAHRRSQLHKLMNAKRKGVAADATRRDSSQARLNELERGVVAADSAADEATVAASHAEEDKTAAEIECRGHSLIGNQLLDTSAVQRLIEDFRNQGDRLVAYVKLAARFNELAGAARNESEHLNGLRRELLAVTNLFCCTTTGVGGSPELRDAVFDTLIVDEASRVTDSEFLIGAIRARRWILVGDEHQLPPYVEQNNEHFIHALSAIHQAEATGKTLDTTVDELGRVWEEDEELHRFRRDSVLQFAESLRDAGEWESTYRKAYQSGIDHLSREVGDPSKALLQAMRECLIHSLLERVVRDGPPSMRVRLVEQRRMIEPIAAIVSMPVYRGDYQTPPPEDLARSGVTPLTTPAFPRRSPSLTRRYLALPPETSSSTTALSTEPRPLGSSRRAERSTESWHRQDTPPSRSVSWPSTKPKLSSFAIS